LSPDGSRSLEGRSVETLWRIRRARAVHLLGEIPHAEEILDFYVGLTEAQERVAYNVPAVDWLELVRASEGDFPWFQVRKIPLDELADSFRDFLSEIEAIGTETLKDGAQALLSRDDSDRREPLRAALEAWGKANNEDDDHHFYTRAFLEPVVTSIAQAHSSQPTTWTGNVCLACGGLPQLAVIRDLPDAVGARNLTCSMCATEWRFRRLTCPYCGETDAAKLPVHTAESIAHVRVDACTSCSRYITTVDLRKRGDAIPLVDALATVELDLWAREQGLTKIRANVLGL
jgi:formate dehydrogenase accessory protein FdhE